MILGANERAWSGINILIFGKTPLLPMKIEQSMAAASPANEVKIDSFEDYNQAYDFCKSQKNVGLIFIQENSDDILSADTFKQLAIGYESKGWPCFGVLVHENQKSMMGYLSMQKNKNLISYTPASDLLDSKRTFSTMNDVWVKFIEAFENNVIPQKLQETLLSMAEPVLSTESFLFQSRTVTALSQNLNISWLDMIAMKWQPVVEAVKKVNQDALKPNGALTQITSLAAFDFGSLDLLGAATAKTGLPSRISAIAELLDNARIKNTLSGDLASIKTAVRPGASALVKQINNCQDKILQIASESSIDKIRGVL